MQQSRVQQSFARNRREQLRRGQPPMVQGKPLAPGPAPRRCRRQRDHKQHSANRAYLTATRPPPRWAPSPSTSAMPTLSPADQAS